MVDYANPKADVNGLWKHGRTLYRVDYKQKQGLAPIMKITEVETGKEYIGALHISLKRVMSTLDQEYISIRRYHNGQVSIVSSSKQTYNTSIINRAFEDGPVVLDDTNGIVTKKV